MSESATHAELVNDAPDENRTNHIVRRQFDGVTMSHENAATQSLIAKSMADSQTRWLVAMKRPRDMNIVRQDMIQECKRPGFARSAIYAVPRGGTMIKGLTIRFAEVAMRCFGNMNAEAQTLFDSNEERVVRVTVTEYEANTSWTRDITIKKTKEVKQLSRGQRPIRSRANSYGETVYIVDATDDDVTMKESSAISKASRTGILRMIPGHIQEEMRALCERTAADAAAKDPDAERNQMLDAFASINIAPDSLVEYLGHPIEKCTPVELTELRFLFGALRDGQADWGTVTADVKKTREALKEKAAAHLGKAAPKTDAPKAEPAKPEPAKKSGTAAAKDKIAKAAAPAPAQAAPTEHPARPAPEPTKPAAEPAPILDLEERQCFTCGAPIEVPANAKGGQQCTDCKG